MPQPQQLVISEDAQGKYTLDVSRLTSVGIKNITLVERHDINTLFGSRSHVVRFVNGGVLRFAYNAKNEFIELTASNLTMHLSKSGAAIFDIFDDCEHG
jgi:hypothetical protein